jgi:exopolyphosphatase/guanosine-5'-triphosphate,3'-diphosphate pyrophosphatase
MKKVAAIDIGTNSMRLLLCEYDGQHVHNKKKDLIVTRMGQGVSAKGVISKEAMERNLAALKVFGQKAQEYGASEIIAIATSAVRDAANRDEFTAAAKEETGMDIRIISGELEADLGITGVLSEYTDAPGSLLVLDIGGGSTELILGNTEGIHYAKSINAGTVRMTEGFVTAHPIQEQEIEKMNIRLAELFEEPVKKLQNMKIEKVIAIGGTATTIAAIYHGLSIYHPQVVHNSIIPFEYLQELFRRLKDMTVEQRFDVKGLQKERADVVPAGMAILLHLMRSLGFDCFTVSENDNLEGAVIKLL